MNDYDNPELYDIAKRICLRMGLPWMDPRTGETHKPENMKIIDITKETKRRSRESVGPVPKTKVIRDKRRKKPKHKKEVNDVSTD